jgi:hypothetical protein
MNQCWRARQRSPELPFGAPFSRDRSGRSACLKPEHCIPKRDSPGTKDPVPLPEVHPKRPNPSCQSASILTSLKFGVFLGFGVWVLGSCRSRPVLLRMALRLLITSHVRRYAKCAGADCRRSDDRSLHRRDRVAGRPEPIRIRCQCRGLPNWKSQLRCFSWLERFLSSKKEDKNGPTPRLWPRCR